MNFTEVPIEPKEFVTIKTSNKISIFVTRVKLFQQAEIQVRFLDEIGNCIDNNVFIMEGADYFSWTNDDQYVVDWVLAKLGLNPSTQIVG
jgi:hypothetical protein